MMMMIICVQRNTFIERVLDFLNKCNVKRFNHRPSSCVDHRMCVSVYDGHRVHTERYSKCLSRNEIDMRKCSLKVKTNKTHKHTYSDREIH